MKALVQKVFVTARSEKAYTWYKLISVTGAAQIVVQAIGLVSGILIIRLLSTHEYGLYTLSNTMLGTMIVLADGGISTGVLSQGGKVWKDKERLGIVLATGLDLRKKFAVGSLLIAVPLLVYLLRSHGAGWGMAVIIILCLVPAFLTSLSGSLLQIVPKLNQDIFPLQKNNVLAGGARFIALLSLFVFPWSFVAMLAYGLPQIWANINLRKISSRYANWNQQPDPEVRKNLLNVVKRLLPSAVYYCLSGQITIWLISIFGSTSSVAQIGAIGRIAMLLNLVTVIFATLVSPRFARLPPLRSVLLKRFLQVQVSMTLLCGAIVGLVWLFSSQVLWVLGKNYFNLELELVLNIMGSAIGLTAGISAGLFTSRGWTLNPLFSVPVSILAIALGIIFLDISTLKGVLTLNILGASTQFLINGGYCLSKILKLPT